MAPLLTCAITSTFFWPFTQFTCVLFLAIAGAICEKPHPVQFADFFWGKVASNNLCAPRSAWESILTYGPRSVISCVRLICLLCILAKTEQKIKSSSCEETLLKSHRQWSKSVPKWFWRLHMITLKHEIAGHYLYHVVSTQLAILVSGWSVVNALSEFRVLDRIFRGKNLETVLVGRQYETAA